MELQQLRYVAAVARERHFLRAAERLHVSQPTLSQQISKLERELGSPLFERAPRQVRLTPEGERFLPHALAILTAVDEAVGAVRAGAAGLGGRVVLGVIPTIGPYLLPAFLSELKRAAPALEIELHDLTTSLLLAALREGRIQMGVLALPIGDPSIAARPIGREPMLLAVAKKHPFARRRAVTARDVAGEPLLMLQEGHCFRDQSLAYCRSSRRDINVVFEGSNLTGVMRLAAAGQGITFVPRMAAIAREHPDLAFVPVSAPAPSREIGVVWRMSTPLNRAQTFVLDTLEKTAGRRLARGGGG